MCDLRDKAWVAAAINIKFSGEEINIQDEENITPEHVNTQIVDCLKFYKSSKKFDKALLNQFKEDFDGWTVNIFKLTNKDILRELEDRLKNGGVYVGGQGQVSDQLFHLLKCDQYPKWPADELELHLQKGTEFKSRRYNPNFDGQQDFILRNRQSKSPQPKIVPKSEPSLRQTRPPISDLPTQPSVSSPAINNLTQSPARITLAKVLMDLEKLYADLNDKFGGSFYDELDAKLRIFYDMCDKAGVTSNLYSVAYSTMLKDKAQDFYYQHLARQNLSFDEMVDKTRSYFHTPENYQAYLMEWRSTMLKSTMEAKPEKNMSDCLEMVIDKLQRVHQGLVNNCQDNHSLPRQLISACQGVEACSVVLFHPAMTFEGIVSDLRNTVGMWSRSHSLLLRAFKAMVIDGNIQDTGQYHLDRRYIVKGLPRGRSGYQGGTYSRGDFKRNNSLNERQQKKCFFSGKSGC